MVSAWAVQIPRRGDASFVSTDTHSSHTRLTLKRVLSSRRHSLTACVCHQRNALSR